MFIRRHFFPCLSAFFFAAVAACTVTPAWAIGFQQISPEELKMTAEPKAPGAPAIILYREVDRDDHGGTAHEDVYFRIKILTEEGRKYADVEVQYLREQQSIGNVHARTIRPDGTAVNYSGKVFDKTIVKGHGVKYLAKTFTLPEVQVGSILEYYYTADFNEYYVFDSHWILSDELFTRSARFTLKPYEGMAVRWTWHLLPEGTAQPKDENHVITLNVNNVPAFQSEDYMPPENELKSRVDFIYSNENFEKDAEKYWKRQGKKLNEDMESFTGKHKGMEQAVSEIVGPGDSPDEKLQKIYARVQKIRNMSYEVQKTEQERKREKEKDVSNVEDVWKRQYGEGWQLTWLFLGLARAAGFDASGMWLADRRNYFFNTGSMDGRKLDENVVVVKVNGKNMFFDPGTLFMPYGLLPWTETGVMGLKLDKDGGSWLRTDLPESSVSRVERKADLKLSDTGDLSGKVTMTFTGLEASWRRVDERQEDEAQRKKFMEDELKSSIPVGCEVELTKAPDWNSSSPTLVGEFEVKIPGWVSGAGRRALLPVGLFSAPEKRLFDHAERIQPIYFSFPFRRDDEVSIEMPLGWQVSSTPPAENYDQHVVAYALKAVDDKGILRVNRSLNIDFLLLDTKYYGALRSFFQGVRTADEQQIVLLPARTSAAN